MFEEDHSESPRKFSTVLLLAAGGVIVATVFATLASMLATGSKPAAGPPENKAEVDQTASTSTSVGIAPDGSKSTVVIKVPSTVKPKTQHVEQPADVPEVVVIPTPPAPTEATTTSPQSTPPTSWPPTSTTSSSSTTTTTTTAPTTTTTKP